MNVRRGTCPHCSGALTIDDDEAVAPEVAALTAAVRRQEIAPPAGMSLNGPEVTAAAAAYVGGIDRSGGTSDDLADALNRAVGGNGAGPLHQSGA